MNRKLRILFCAQDYGSLEQNIFLLKILKEDKKLDIKNSLFICNKLFKNKIAKNIIKKVFFIKNLNQNFSKKIIGISLLNRIDLAVVGLSYKFQSLDYKITDVMNKQNIKTLCIQDFWGNVGNFDKKVYPQYLLVADKYAKNLTNKKIKSKIIVSGLPKYLDKKPIINFNNNNNNNNNLLIIGQPDYVPGINIYFKFLNKLNLKNIDQIFYLPHPMEVKKKKFFKKKTIKFINRKNLSKYLNNKLIVINSFSTLSYDILFSAIFSKKKVNYKIIFLSFRSKLMNFIKLIVGSENLPLTNYRNIFQLSNYDNCDIKIQKIINKKYLSCNLIKNYFQTKHQKKIFLDNLYKIVRN